MRILTVTHFYESHGGGIERVAGQLCRHFAQLGASVVWAASHGDDTPRSAVDVAPLHCINPTEKLTGLPMPIPGLRGIQTLWRQVRRSDAVVIHDALYVTSIIALLIAKAQRKPTILIQHIAGIPFSSVLLRGLMRAANGVVTRPMLWAADRRIFISETVRENLLGNRGPHASELLFNGVDRRIFHPGERRTPHALAGLDLDRAKRRMLFVGRYVEKKGLAVVRALATSRPDLLFVLAGTGPLKPSQWELANVHDLGPQAQQSIADLYRWADFLILPSVGEGFPLVIQEAMACGLPVICGSPTNRADPAAAKWLRGVAVDLTAPEVSARRCSDLIDSLHLSQHERAEMACYALRQYDWRGMAERLIEVAQGLRGESAA